jgi:outer membrane receptor protein involved in Fe transport
MLRCNTKLVLNYVAALCLSLSLIFISSSALAQSETRQTTTEQAIQTTPKDNKEDQENQKFMVMDEVVVTATRQEAQLKHMTSSVTVIGPKELAASPSLAIDDVLRSVAGLDFWGSDIAYGGFRSINMRGTGGGNDQGRTLILVDGLPINDTWDGNVAWSQISREDIERIEVVRGPASALYGGSAMGGVINMITKDPADKPVSFKVKTGYGSLQHYNAYANVSGRVTEGKMGYYFSALRDENEGYEAVRDYDGQYETNTDRHISNFFGKLNYLIDQNSNLTLTSSYFDEKRNRGFKYSNTNPREISKINLTYRRKDPDGLSLLSSVYWQKEDMTTEFTNSRRIGSVPAYGMQTAEEVKHKPFYGFIFQPSYALTDWDALTVGFEYKRSELEHRNVEFGDPDTVQEVTGKQEYYGLYAQNETFLFGDRLVISLGARGDWWKNFDGSLMEDDPDDPVDTEYPTRTWNSFNPKLGLAYHPVPNATIRGAVGTGYRAPTPARMYTNLRRGRQLTLANPDLDAENVKSVELGVDYQFGNFARVSLTGYYTKIEDCIASRTIIADELGQYANIGEISTKGIEFESTFNFDRYWSGYFNFTFNDSTIEDDPENEGNTLEGSPRFKFNTGLTFDHPEWFNATLQGRYVDSMFNDNENTEELDSYFVLDFKISRKFFDMATLYLTVENMLNTEYEWQCYTTVYESPGTLLMAGVSLAF